LNERERIDLLQISYECEQYLIGRYDSTDLDISRIKRVNQLKCDTGQFVPRSGAGYSAQKFVLIDLNLDARALENVNSLIASLEKSGSTRSRDYGFFFSAATEIMKKSLELLRPAFDQKMADLVKLYDKLEVLCHQQVILNHKSKETRIQLIHLASYFGFQDVLRELIGRGIDVNVKDEFGFTALHWAALGGQVATAEVLIEKNIDIRSLDITGCPFQFYGDEQFGQLISKKIGMTSEGGESLETQLQELKQQVSEMRKILLSMGHQI
jgi:hypothetical protein